MILLDFAANLCELHEIKTFSSICDLSNKSMGKGPWSVMSHIVMDHSQPWASLGELQKNSEVSHKLSKEVFVTYDWG